MKYMHRLCSRGPLELLEVPGMKTSVPSAFVHFPFLGFNYAVRDSLGEREREKARVCRYARSLDKSQCLAAA